MTQVHSHEGPSSANQHAEQRRNRIQALNDAFRHSGLSEAWGAGRIVLSAGVSGMPWANKFALLQMVKAFDAFTPDIDPHGEHDFGALIYKGERYFWKIDCYDHSLKAGSLDRANASLTSRVLTVLLASEY